MSLVLLLRSRTLCTTITLCRSYRSHATSGASTVCFEFYKDSASKMKRPCRVVATFHPEELVLLRSKRTTWQS